MLYSVTAESLAKGSAWPANQPVPHARQRRVPSGPNEGLWVTSGFHHIGPISIDNEHL